MPGIAPPQKPMSTYAWVSAVFRLSASAGTSQVGGMLLSGMSMIVVTPPAAAARVAVVKPSQSVRPGSFTCTWESTRPGSSTSSSAEAQLRRGVEFGVVRRDRDDPAVTHPDSAATSPAASPPGVP